jgi:hypothetical protein
MIQALYFGASWNRNQRVTVEDFAKDFNFAGVDIVQYLFATDVDDPGLPDGAYLMNAEGMNERGERVAERPQRLIPDGRPYPVPDFPGLKAVTTKPQPNAIHAEVRREDGTIAGQGRYVVADDGQSLSAATAGFDTQLRRFETLTVWDRQ